MATIRARKRADGSTGYYVEIRIKRKSEIVHRESKTFQKRKHAEMWARQRESELDDPRVLEKVQHRGLSVGDVLTWYRDDMGHLRSMGRSKNADLTKLINSELADLDAIQLTSGQIIDHLMERLKTVKPQTANNDLAWLRVAFKSAKVSKGWPVALEAVEEATLAAKSERLVARSAIRQRRPTEEELEKLDKYFTSRDGRAAIPMRDIMWFAIHSARRQAEVTRLEWSDNNKKEKTGLVRNLKHPREKLGNHKRFAYTEAAWDIIQRQPQTSEFIFPYNSKSVSAAFTRACKVLEIEDLHFHDLRHEGTSRLFEAGYSIQEVQLFTLHEDWKVLQRYTHLRPGEVQRR